MALLPGTTVELMVGRAGTLAALDRAGADRMVFAQQLRANQATPRSGQDLHSLACTGRVLQRWTTASGQQKVRVEGLTRVSISSLQPQLILLNARVNPAPAQLDEDAAEATMATYALWSEKLGLQPHCADAKSALYRMAKTLGDRLSTSSVLACTNLSEVLVEVLERLDARSGVAWVH
jgi:ATP-dependent Lon protease